MIIFTVSFDCKIIIMFLNKGKLFRKIKVRLKSKRKGGPCQFKTIVSLNAHLLSDINNSSDKDFGTEKNFFLKQTFYQSYAGILDMCTNFN